MALYFIFFSCKICVCVCVCSKITKTVVVCSSSGPRRAVFRFSLRRNEIQNARDADTFAPVDRSAVLRNHLPWGLDNAHAEKTR